jgi:hypothetical protein
VIGPHAVTTSRSSKIELNTRSRDSTRWDTMATTASRRFITINLDLPDWYGLFDKKPLVDALIDRLQHHCITIRIDGPSPRSPDPPAPPPVSPKRRTTEA